MPPIDAEGTANGPDPYSCTKAQNTNKWPYRSEISKKDANGKANSTNADQAAALV